MGSGTAAYLYTAPARQQAVRRAHRSLRKGRGSFAPAQICAKRPHHDRRSRLPRYRLPAQDRLSDEGRTAAEGTGDSRSEDHTSELQSLMRISSAVICFNTYNNVIP